MLTGRIVHSEYDFEHLPNIFNKALLTEYVSKCSPQEINTLLLELEYVSMFLIKLVQSYSEGYKSLTRQYKKVFQLLDAVKLEGKVERHSVHLAAKPQEQPTAYIWKVVFPNAENYAYQKFIVSTYLKLDTLAPILGDLNRIESQKIRTTENQKMLIHFLETAKYIHRMRLNKTTPDIDNKINYFSQHINFFRLTLLTDQTNFSKSNFLSPNQIEDILLQIPGEASGLAAIRQMLVDIQFGLTQIYTNFLEEFTFEDKIQHKNPFDLDAYKAILIKYFNAESIVNVSLIYKQLPNIQKLKSLLQLEVRLRYLIESFSYQTEILDGNSQQNSASLRLSTSTFTELREPEERWNELSKYVRLLDYTSTDKSRPNQQSKHIDALIALKPILFCEPYLDSFAIYYTSKQEMACLNLRILRDWVFNTELFNKKFFNKQLILDELNHSPISITYLFEHLPLVLFFIANGLDRLTGKLLTRKIVCVPPPPNVVDVDLIFMHNPHGTVKKLLCFSAQLTLESKHLKIIEKYINFDSLSDYLNDLVTKTQQKLLLELSSLYLDAHNMCKQIELIYQSLNKQFPSYFATYVFLPTLKQRIERIKDQIPSKWFEMMVPNPQNIIQNLERQHLTPAPIGAKSKSKQSTGTKDEDLLSISIADELKQETSETMATAVTTMSKELMQETEDTNTHPAAPMSNELTTESDDANTPPASPRSETPTNQHSEDSPPEDKDDTKKSASAIPATDPLKQKVEKLQYDFYSIRDAVKAIDETLSELGAIYLTYFTDEIANNKKNILELKEKIFNQFSTTRDEIRESKNKWNVTKENISTARQDLQNLINKISDLKTAMQQAKRQLAHEQFQLERHKKSKKFHDEEKPRRNEEKKEPRERRPRPVPVTPPQKPISFVKQNKPAQSKTKTDYLIPLRLKHLNQAVKSLIYIRKILDCYAADVSKPEADILKPEVIHFALLFNIFRCFQSLKMYQHCGGIKQAIDAAIVTDLRNMIIHHGARKVEKDEVIDFAMDIKGKLPEVILNLKTEHLLRFEVEGEIRKELITEFKLAEITGLFSLRTNHANLILDNTPFYHSLVAFHAPKQDNNSDSKDIYDLWSYMAEIGNISRPLFTKSFDMTPDKFVDTFLFQIQALLMLVTICGEIGRSSGIYHPFISYSIRIRNLIGHDLSLVNNNQDYCNFVNSLRLQTGYASQNHPFFTSAYVPQSQPTGYTNQAPNLLKC